jgi:hypothetical protein
LPFILTPWVGFLASTWSIYQAESAVINSYRSFVGPRRDWLRRSTPWLFAAALILLYLYLLISASR